jgi:hypothetical protein
MVIALTGVNHASGSNTGVRTYREETPMMKKSVLALFVMALISVQAVPGLAGHQDRESSFDTMMDHYIGIQTALAADSLDEIAVHALAIKMIAGQIHEESATACQGVSNDKLFTCQQMMAAISTATTRLAEATDLEEARATFGELSDSMIQFRNLLPGERPNVAYCPMAKRSWLQHGDVIANPYYGSAMLRCGYIVEK